MYRAPSVNVNPSSSHFAISQQLIGQLNSSDAREILLQMTFNNANMNNNNAIVKDTSYQMRVYSLSFEILTHLRGLAVLLHLR
jgi:hypothetical protein